MTPSAQFPVTPYNRDAEPLVEMNGWSLHFEGMATIQETWTISIYCIH
jgi:hypothetical protein